MGGKFFSRYVLELLSSEARQRSEMVWILFSRVYGENRDRVFGGYRSRRGQGRQAGEQEVYSILLFGQLWNVQKEEPGERDCDDQGTEGVELFLRRRPGSHIFIRSKRRHNPSIFYQNPLIVFQDHNAPCKKEIDPRSHGTLSQTWSARVESTSRMEWPMFLRVSRSLWSCRHSHIV